MTVPEPADLLRPAPSRRERARAATIDEIKQTASQLMREQGTTDLKFSDIARVMGMTAPALYRYFADRDELLTALIVDAFDELGRIVAEARDRVPADDPGGRLNAVSEAYRGWARREPEKFALLFGLPVPGYAAPEDGPTTEAANRAMGQLKALFHEAAVNGQLGRPLIDQTDEAVAEFCAADTEDNPGGAQFEPETFQAMLHCWATLHGFASLEAYGHLDWLTPEARDAVFATGVRLAAVTAGLPPPSNPR